MCPWTPQHGALQPIKVTHAGTEQKGHMRRIEGDRTPPQPASSCQRKAGFQPAALAGSVTGRGGGRGDDGGHGAAPVVIGKLLGSLVAPVAADRGLTAAWFTPPADEPTVAALRRAMGPCLLAGGTADPFWDGETARSLTPDVVEIDGADHRMLLPGRLAASAAALGRISTAVEDFFDRLVWPDMPRQHR
jgi:hypothetical protein